MDQEQDASEKESLEKIGCDLARDLYNNIGKRELWLSIIMSVLRQVDKTTARIPSATLDEIAAEHRSEVDKLLSGHYTATKSPADCIAALTADALAKAAAVWETRLAELERDGKIMCFLDAIETTEIVTADGGDRDVDPDGFGFSDQMLKLIEAIAEDENDVWNTAARCALAGPAPAVEPQVCPDCKGTPLTPIDRNGKRYLCQTCKGKSPEQHDG